MVERYEVIRKARKVIVNESDFLAVRGISLTFISNESPAEKQINR